MQSEPTPEAGVTVGDVVGVVERAYPPALAESWDAVGLVCGDRGEPARGILVCVDVTDAVVDAAVESGVGVVVAHHPLLMRGVTSLAADTAKGRIVHRLIRNGIALLSAHTNADRARPGVSDALAERLGVLDTAPIEPKPVAPLDKWVVMVPEGNVEQVSEAMFAAGAGSIGDYRDCSWTVVGTGQFEAQEAASPTIGEIGMRTHVDEARVEMVADRAIRASVLRALRNAHPYEEPAFDVFELADMDSDIGLGRIGSLAEPTTLREFTATVARALGNPWGIRAAGDPDMPVRTVAVCGGAGDSLIERVRGLGVDVYVTADLRHHPVDESLRVGAPALIDAGHWATEFPWCAQVAALLRSELGTPVAVFEPPTDPFGLHSFG
ncbi:Nif3-like dinuclear metal center hexameric protein [Gordonia sp. zg691]|uniref:GTP cyclohydrolase 1 type 2 homolog n=1 Tax=Gordonia jinghuaiqii TaxID=2758710 RepID=A0A7D7LPS2_9ACTN|nr:Nif3-like dinuclear metal center hexameric protein [Gordonia jinghuaiqii]MBD0860010.1 Nif3-like dinuclear metal center hexameric protein [Gordonia jinghuaiqii]MCR5977176.1 Nif3-like dinuclear metal center hexameric protein [Gordonia jinghuaiqii]QMT00223.1 Nif3-like dinuclear metal center hexameric protein [Gordonia jinghuaiqii]